MNKWDQEEIEHVKKLISEGKSYQEIGNILGRTGKSVALHMQKLGFKYSDFYTRPINNCECCGEEITNYNEKFCSHSCSAKVTNLKRKSKKSDLFCENCGCSLRNKSGKKFCSSSCQHEKQNRDKISSWLKGIESGHTGKNYSIKNFLRKYLIEEADNKCSKCGWGEINESTGKSFLEINHIDGDASNSRKENLEVLCPNCHSLTPNFRALNKNSARNRK